MVGKLEEELGKQQARFVLANAYRVLEGAKAMGMKPYTEAELICSVLIQPFLDDKDIVFHLMKAYKTKLAGKLRRGASSDEGVKDEASASGSNVAAPSCNLLGGRLA